MKTSIKNIILFPLNVLYSISPEAAIKILFRIKTGYRLNLENPTTFSEKIQWMKLNYHNPVIPQLVDKYLVRDYVSKCCPELLVKLLWSGYDVDSIPWDELPNRFVIKATHGSGYNIICTDKSKLDIPKTQKTISVWLKEPFLKCYGEWFYRVNKPRIIIEEFLDNGSGTAPEDYKFFCFDGEPKYISVDTDRFSNHKKNVYDLEWNYLSGVKLDLENDKPVAKPDRLADMLNYARTLSKGFPNLRVDLYLVKGKIYFGELTFTPGAGFDRITPRSFDYELGKHFNLPEEII